MLVSKSCSAFAEAILVVPCALAQTKTRLPEVGAGAVRAGAQGYTPLVTATGPKTDTPVREPAASVVVIIPNEMLRAQSALPLDDAICYASSPFDISPLPPLRTARFSHS